MKFFVNLVDVVYFLGVGTNHLLFLEEIVKFLVVLLLEVSLELVAFGLQAQNNLAEAPLNIFSLLQLQPLDFAGLVVDEHLVVFVDAARVVQEFLKVADVLFQHGSHFFQLGKFVAVVVLEHAARANKLVANAAEVFNLLLRVLKAVHTSLVGQFRLR